MGGPDGGKIVACTVTLPIVICSKACRCSGRKAVLPDSTRDMIAMLFCQLEVTQPQVEPICDHINSPTIR